MTEMGNWALWRDPFFQWWLGLLRILRVFNDMIILCKSERWLMKKDLMDTLLHFHAELINFLGRGQGIVAVITCQAKTIFLQACALDHPFYCQIRNGIQANKISDVFFIL